MDLEEAVRARLTAYIHPNKARTKAQLSAFEEAVEAQVEYEQSNPLGAALEGALSVSNDGISVTYAGQGGKHSMYTQATISPAAYAFLFNAGLLKSAIPRARRL